MSWRSELYSSLTLSLYFMMEVMFYVFISYTGTYLHRVFHECDRLRLEPNLSQMRLSRKHKHFNKEGCAQISRRHQIKFPWWPVSELRVISGTESPSPLKIPFIYFQKINKSSSTYNLRSLNKRKSLCRGALALNYLACSYNSAQICWVVLHMCQIHGNKVFWREE